jgi:hypothetical protein
VYTSIWFIYIYTYIHTKPSLTACIGLLNCASSAVSSTFGLCVYVHAYQTVLAWLWFQHLIFVCTRMCMCFCVNVIHRKCIHTYIHIYIHTYTHIHTHTNAMHNSGVRQLRSNVRGELNECIHTYINTYIHTHTHTHKRHTQTSGLRQLSSNVRGKRHVMALKALRGDRRPLHTFWTLPLRTQGRRHQAYRWV